MLLSARRTATATKSMRYDNWQTPAEVIEPLLQTINLPGQSVIEDPFYGDGSSGKILRRLLKGAHRVIHRRKEFFSNPLTKPDYLITCGPFSFTKDTIKRFFEKDKPFALLVRSSVLHAEWFQEMFVDRSFQVVFLTGRPKGLPFNVVWIVYNVPMRVRKLTKAIVCKNL